MVRTLSLILLWWTVVAHTPCAWAADEAGQINIVAPAKDPLPPEEDSVHVDQFSFVVYGDTRGRREGKDLQSQHESVVESILESIKKRSTTAFPIRFVLHTGDAVVDGRDARRWNSGFVSLINRITTEGRVPVFMTPGNHDMSESPEFNPAQSRDLLANYLQAAAQLIPPPAGARRRLAGYPCYAFGYGNSFFVALDSNLAVNRTQLDWLTNQLASVDRQRYTNVFAFWHHPPYSSGPHGGANVEPITAMLRTNFMPVMREYHVAAVFCGHEHFFEHWVERYEDRAGNSHRLDVVTTGGGGAPVYGYRGEPKLTDYAAYDESEKLNVEHLVRPASKPGDNPFHYVIVRVDKSRLMFEVVGVETTADYRPYRSNRFYVD